MSSRFPVDPSFRSAVGLALTEIGFDPNPPPGYDDPWLPPQTATSLPPPYPSRLQSFLELAGRVYLYVRAALQVAGFLLSALAIARRTTPAALGGILIADGACTLLSNIISLIKQPKGTQFTCLSMTVGTIKLLVGALTLSGVLPLKSAGWLMVGSTIGLLPVACSSLSYAVSYSADRARVRAE